MLFPRAVLPSLLHLTPEWLRARGLKGVILDLDNTLLPYGEEEIPSDHRTWLEGLKAEMPVYPLSNALPERFARVQKALGLPGHAPALKPWLGFRKALRALELPPSQVAVVGDQIFTDVLGGNLVGAYTVLVPPLREREFFYTRFIRMLETPFRKPRGGLG
uniref:YqeG family HAD IIIA-type phosphatase n=1 Tax=Thermus tengchongensis TaxID=1214928 RepID=A0A7C6E2U9_9DEIN